MDSKKALIIGCGRMGCFYDKPESRDIESHAHALSLNNYELYFYDINTENANAAAVLWKGHAVKEIASIFYDVVVLATETSSHYKILNKLNKNEFGTLVVEKPFCHKNSLAHEILELFKDKLLFINYSRLYLKEYDDLRLNILKDEFGECIRFSGVYSRGLLNNGSHMFSLLHFLLNIDGFSSKINRKSIETVSGFTNYDVYLENEKGLSGALIGVDDSMYSIWEVVLYFERAVVRINDFGREIAIQKLEENSGNAKKALRLNLVKYKIDYNMALLGLYIKVAENDNIFAKMTTKNALFVHKVIENILEEK